MKYFLDGLVMLVRQASIMIVFIAGTYIDARTATEVPREFEPAEMPHDFDAAKDLERRSQERRDQAERDLQDEEERGASEKDIAESRAHLSQAEIDIKTATLAEQYFSLPPDAPERVEVEAKVKEQQEEIARVKEQIQEMLQEPTQDGVGLTTQQKESYGQAIGEVVSSNRQRMGTVVATELARMESGSVSKYLEGVAFASGGNPDYQMQLDVLYSLKNAADAKYGDAIPADLKPTYDRMVARITAIEVFTPDATSANALDEQLRLHDKITPDQRIAMRDFLRDKNAFAKQYPDPEAQLTALDELQADIGLYGLDSVISDMQRETMNAWRNGAKIELAKTELTDAALRDFFVESTLSLMLSDIAKIGNYLDEQTALEGFAARSDVQANAELSADIAKRLEQVKTFSKQSNPENPTDLAQRLELDKKIPLDQEAALKEHFALALSSGKDQAGLEALKDTIKQYGLEEQMADTLAVIDAALDAMKPKEPVVLPKNMSEEEAKLLQDLANAQQQAEATAAQISSVIGYGVDGMRQAVVWGLDGAGKWLGTTFETPKWAATAVKAPDLLEQGIGTLQKVQKATTGGWVTVGGSQAVDLAAKMIGLTPKEQAVVSRLDAALRGEQDPAVVKALSAARQGADALGYVGQVVIGVTGLAKAIGDRFQESASALKTIEEKFTALSEQEELSRYIEVQRGRINYRDRGYIGQVRDAIGDFFKGIKDTVTGIFSPKADLAARRADFEEARSALLKSIKIDEVALRRKGMSDGDIASVIKDALSSDTYKDDANVQKLGQDVATHAAAYGKEYARAMEKLDGISANMSFMVDAYDAYKLGPDFATSEQAELLYSVFKLQEMRTAYLGALRDAVAQLREDTASIQDVGVNAAMDRMTGLLNQSLVDEIRDYSAQIDTLGNLIKQQSAALKNDLASSYGSRATGVNI